MRSRGKPIVHSGFPLFALQGIVCFPHKRVYRFKGGRRSSNDVTVEAQILGGVFGPTGEWTKTISIQCYEGICKYFSPAVLKEKNNPKIAVGLVASNLVVADQDELVKDILPLLEDFCGLPVVDKSKQIIGIISIKGVFGKSEFSKVRDVMSPPSVTIGPKQSVAEAAGLMLKHGLHRLPIVNEVGECTGMITRTEVFAHIFSDKEAGELIHEHLLSQVKQNELDPKLGVGTIANPAMVLHQSQPLEDIVDLFEDYSGFPVIGDWGSIAGVISVKDAFGARKSAIVKDLMSTPAVTIRPNEQICVAAGIMLKHNVYRLPIVNLAGDCIGIVTRSDIFSHLIPEHRSKLKLLNLKIDTNTEVSQVMGEPATIDQNLLVRDVLAILEDYHRLPVVNEDNEVVGSLSIKDIWDKSEWAIVRDIMTLQPPIVSGSKMIYEGLAIMQKYNIRLLPVVNESNVCVGLLNRDDLEACMNEEEVVRSLKAMSSSRAKKMISPNTAVDTVVKPATKIYECQHLGEVLHLFEEFCSVPVLNESHNIAGTLSVRDIFGKGEQLKVKDVMSPFVSGIDNSRSLKEAAGMMLKHNIRRLPVVNPSGECKGIMNLDDLSHIVNHHDSPALNGSSEIDPSSQVGKITIDALAVEEDQSVSDIWALHEDDSGLPVMDDLKNFLGVLTVQDICNQSEWATVGDVMSSHDLATSPNAVPIKPKQLIRDVLSYFEDYVGCPVLDKAKHVVGVISIKDIFGKNGNIPVKDVMSAPAAVIQHDQSVLAAAVLMLMHKLRRLPVVNQEGECIGIVTRFDAIKHLSC